MQCWTDASISNTFSWASYQIRKIAGCACTGNAGNVSPRRRLQRKPLVSDPGMHHDTCVSHVPWCMSGSLTRGGGENVPGIPGACAPAILHIWQEVHGRQGPDHLTHTYSATHTTPWLMMIRQRREPMHRQSQYWPGSTGIFRFQHLSPVSIPRPSFSGMGVPIVRDKTVARPSYL